MTTPLCSLANLHNTDKWVYTPFYYELLKDKRDSFKKILELGVGCPKVMKHVKDYKAGASLKMWRDFFPNAQIYGIDIAPEAIFEEERIKTFLCNETNKEELVELIETIGNDIDLVVDDGSHNPRHQVFAFQTLMPLLKKDVIYIIEDVRFKGYVSRHLSNYDYQTPDNLATIIVKNKI